MDGGVLAGRFLERENLVFRDWAIPEEKWSLEETWRSTFKGNTVEVRGRKLANDKSGTSSNV